MRQITVNGIVWNQKEAGRWCSELGEVLWEPTGKPGSWWWWKSPEGEDGPYKSMRAAMEAALDVMRGRDHERQG